MRSLARRSLVECIVPITSYIMKRYLAFNGSVYYPSGGIDDFLGDFETIEEAIEAVTEKVMEDQDHYEDEDVEDRWKYAWAHVWDSETRKKAWSR